MRTLSIARAALAALSMSILISACGGGGSQSTWQAYGSLGVDPSTYWTLGVAYRWLAVDYNRDNFLYDTTMKGFIFGATYRFK